MLASFRYSEKSDVWAFGSKFIFPFISFIVTIWEIFNNGQIPWPHLSTAEVRGMILSTFEYPAQGSCTPGAYQVMKSCLRMSPEERPTFEHIKVELAAVYVL